jgi:hypothetical protein
MRTETGPPDTAKEILTVKRDTFAYIGRRVLYQVSILDKWLEENSSQGGMKWNGLVVYFVSMNCRG